MNAAERSVGGGDTALERQLDPGIWGPIVLHVVGNFNPLSHHKTDVIVFVVFSCFAFQTHWS